ncbi:putative nucleotidyltransferase component of viral defense system [Pedobacter sp. UYP30]|uniref:nucleotidyl transferase AbiEii/AbiGii toxin family protein n=1 Tax=Pedobacter sp. UYP30 TaxID=1756400 RepID=UPI00339ADA1A
MALKELGNFCLVGGTALSLYYGHRTSVDVDLFSVLKFENEDIIRTLEKNFPGFVYRNANNPIGVFGAIDDLKVDLVNYHHHPLIEIPLFIDGIRLYHPHDILAMKIAAILKRGVKKDFWDIAELLNHFSMQDFIDYYTKKFPSQQLMISIPFAMTYFADAEESEDPISLKGQTWESVKAFISKKVSEYLK